MHRTTGVTHSRVLLRKALHDFHPRGPQLTGVIQHLRREEGLVSGIVDIASPHPSSVSPPTAFVPPSRIAGPGARRWSGSKLTNLCNSRMHCLHLLLFTSVILYASARPLEDVAAVASAERQRVELAKRAVTSPHFTLYS